MPSSPRPAIPPCAERRPVTDTRHGIERTENYAWLRDDNWQEVMRDPSVLRADIRAYLEAENDHTDAVLAPVAPLVTSLVTELRGRIKEDDSSVPSPDGPWDYLMRYRDGGEHPQLCRRPRGDGSAEPTTLLDGDALAEGTAFFRLSGAAHSPDHRLLAYATDTTGSEYSTVRVRDLDVDTLLDDIVEDTTGGVVWSADSSSFLYTELDDNHRPGVVKRHVLGTPAADDTVVFTEADPGMFVNVGATQDERWIVISSGDHESTEAYLVPADAPETAPRLVAARRDEVEYHVESLGDRLVILTNADAEDFRIVTAPLDDPDAWTDLVPHCPGRLLVDLIPFAGHLVWLEQRDALPQIVVHRLSDGEEHTIAFDEDAYDASIHAGYEFDTATLRFTYSSMTTPAQTWDYDLETRERTLRKTQSVPSGHDPHAYVTHRITATSHDGERIPVSILYRADTPLDGSAPAMLYGYGSYGLSTPASFSTNRLSLVDRGFIYAIAHIRGGKEGGFRWYREGKGTKKTNTFQDFVAAGEALVEAGLTSRGRIACHGGSAGGLLVGASINLAPDLFHAAVGEVPFVDVLTTMLDDTLPLTPPEWPEWGNPIIDPEAYATIAAYSPIDNVALRDYPHVYINGGLADPRVTYWEPAKWAATLRERTTGDGTVVLRTNMEAGHGGKGGRFERLAEVAEVYAWLLLVFGLATTDES